MSALPYMQGRSRHRRTRSNWVLTSYIVAAAIMTAPVGGIAQSLRPQADFHHLLRRLHHCLGAVRVGAGHSNQMVLFRLLQGVFGAALVPLSQAVMLDSYALHERAKAMSIWGHGGDDGADHGPVARRLADRNLFLALGVLRQSAVRHRHRAWPLGLHG